MRFGDADATVATLTVNLELTGDLRPPAGDARVRFFMRFKGMANRIAIPKLGVRVAPLQLPEFDTELNPFAPIADAAEKISDAIEARERKERQDKKEQLYKQEEEARRLADLARQQNAPAQPPASDGADAWSSPPNDPIERDRWMKEEARRLREGRDSSSLDTAARSIRLVSVDPNQVGTYREELDQALSVLPEDDQETRAKARRLFSIAYFRALIQQNPKLALETLRSRNGAAEEEWGFGEDVREDLEEEAQRALDAELARPSFEAHPWLFDSVLPRGNRAPDRGGYVFEAWRDYGEALKIYDVEPKAVPWVEAKIDNTIREAQRNRRSVVSVGKSLLGERARAWDGPAIHALDIHARAVIGDDMWSPEARNRMAGLSRLASRAPDVVREQIRSGVRSTDIAKRAFAGHVLVDLDRAGTAAGRDFLTWATPDVRAFGRDFGALRHSGFSDAGAVKRIDEVGSVTPTQREARLRYFEARVGGAALSDALVEAIETQGSDRDARNGERGSVRGSDANAVALADYGSPFGGTIPGGVEPADPNVPRGRYHDDDLNALGGYRPPILDAAQKLGVSETAIAGCIAEEMDDARARGLLEQAQDGVKSLLLDGLTHEDIAAAYDDWERKLAENPEAGTPDTTLGPLSSLPDLVWTKTLYPATLDIGRGKIRLHTAIRLLREYNERYPDTDPLGIKKYNRAYDQLVRNLGSARRDTTAIFAGLMVQEATRWFESKLQDRWAKMSQEDRDALIVEYYNQGRERIQARYEEDIRRDGVYTPELGESGRRHRSNAGLVRRGLYQW